MRPIKLTASILLAAMLTAPGAAGAQPKAGDPPELRPPVNAGGTKKTTPTIVLPPGWANPGTGGSGGAVPEPVVVTPSTGTTGGYDVHRSTGTSTGGSPTPKSKK